MSAKKPKIFLFLKIIAPIMLVLGIALIILGTVVYPEMFNGEPVAPNPALFAPGMLTAVSAIPCFILAFIPEIKKIAVKTQKYITEENKDDLKDVVDMHADIVSTGVTKTASAIKKGLKDTKFCKHCGKEIDADSKYCNSCGQQQ